MARRSDWSKDPEPDHLCDGVVTDLRMTEQIGGVNPPQDASAHRLEEISEDEPIRQPKVKVWVYYNATTGEAILYDGDPPPSFGRREHDIGPIELDQELINTYVTAKNFWNETHAKFITALRAASVSRRSPETRREGAECFTDTTPNQP
jgi:hypothetical protein